MNIYLIYLLIGLIWLAIGYFLGNYIQNLKTKSNQSTLEEERRQLDLAKNNLENRNLGLENEKEELRTEKEQLGNEIVRYQADLEHLSLKNKEQKGEVEKLQEKFTRRNLKIWPIKSWMKKAPSLLNRTKRTSRTFFLLCKRR